MTSSLTKHILLVEDIAVYHDLTQEALKALGSQHQLSIVANGEDALAFIDKRPPFKGVKRPDLIFLDLHLPKLSGYEVLKRIKTDPDLKTIPVIVLTASTCREDIDQCYRLQANCLIRKTANVDQFIRTMIQSIGFWLSIATLPNV